MQKKRGKKGQLMSQPLIYIMAMIVGALILAFGAYAIINLQSAAGATTVKTWIQDFDAEVQSMVFLDIGSATSVNLRLPDKIQYMCVKNADQVRNFPSFMTAEDRALINANPTRNIIFIPTDAYGGIFGKVENLIPEGEISCFHNGVKIRLDTVENGVVQAKQLVN